MKKRYKVVNKRRFYLFITSLFAVISIILFTLNNKAHSSVYKVNYREIQIVEGDTLWNIALDHLPEKTDIRKVIYDIRKFNGMDDYYIYPGDIIKIPIVNK